MQQHVADHDDDLVVDDLSCYGLQFEWVEDSRVFRFATKKTAAATTTRTKTTTQVNILKTIFESHSR